jgi:hypothetical protein
MPGIPDVDENGQTNFDAQRPGETSEQFFARRNAEIEAKRAAAKAAQQAKDDADQARGSQQAGRFNPNFDFSGPNQDAAGPGEKGIFWQNFMKTGAEGAQGRNFGQPNWNDAQQSRGAQGSLLQSLMDTARGTRMRLNPATGQYESVPTESLAQMQLQKASDSNFAQARSMAAGQQGFGHAAGARQVMNQRAAISQQQAADSGILRLQEQQQAQQAAANLAGQMRTGDVNQQQAGSQAALSMQGLNDNQQRAFAELGQRAAAGDRDALMAMETLKGSMQANQNQARLGGAQMQANVYSADRQNEDNKAKLQLAREQFAQAKTEADRNFWMQVIKSLMTEAAGAATGGAAA